MPVRNCELHVGVARLDHPVQPAQVVAVGARHLRGVQHIQDRLVVLVDQHHDGLPDLPAQRPDQMTEPDRCGVVPGHNPRLLCQVGQLRHDILVKPPRFPIVPTAELELHHGMALRPVVAVVDVQPLEQRLVALEELLQRVQEQTLAEPPRARQEVVLALVDQPFEVGGLVHVIAVPLAQGAEGLECRWAVGAGSSPHLTRVAGTAQSPHAAGPAGLLRADGGAGVGGVLDDAVQVGQVAAGDDQGE